MILRTDDVLVMIGEGYNTVPAMAFHILGIEPTQPCKLDERTRRDYDRIAQCLSVRLKRMRRWKEVEVAVQRRGSVEATVWRAVA